jgi:hypothetical protein
MHTSSIQIPTKTSGHGHTSVLQLGLTVISHGLLIFSVGETEGIEEANGGCNTHLVVDPGRELGGLGGGFGGGKGGTSWVGKKDISLDENNTSYLNDGPRGAATINVSRITLIGEYSIVKHLISDNSN